MSNERIIATMNAVEELRDALELWCSRDETKPNALDVHEAGQTAVAAAEQAIRALTSIREQTTAEITRYRRLLAARQTELLTPSRAVLPLSYTCGECGQVFPVDPADPIESHGAYLDHQAEHDADDEADQ